MVTENKEPGGLGLAAAGWAYRANGALRVLVAGRTAVPAAWPHPAGHSAYGVDGASQIVAGSAIG